jgi:hypothetical protein
MMNKRSFRTVAIVIVAAVAVWFGGQFLLHAVAVMHGGAR